MIGRLRITTLVGITIACSLVPTPSAVVAVTSDVGAGSAATEPDVDAEVEPSDDQREMRAELRDLADAWADGGGAFGYPFWEKAGQRWRRNEITATMYREYVTGYRDRLVLGCELIESIDTSTDVASDVRERILDACDARVDALRAQQRWLDALVASSAAADEEEVAKAEARAASHEEDASAALERSYRDTRLAMDQAQAALDQAGLKRLAEDAFL